MADEQFYQTKLENDIYASVPAADNVKNITKSPKNEARWSLRFADGL